jgi:hypothetical protein
MPSGQYNRCECIALSRGSSSKPSNLQKREGELALTVTVDVMSTTFISPRAFEKLRTCEHITERSLVGGVLRIDADIAVMRFSANQYVCRSCGIPR